MEKYRCFIAIDFDPKVCQQIIQMQALFSQESIHSIRWITADNLHLTLKFLGDTDQNNIPIIIEKMNQTSSIFPPFEIKLNKTSVFPNWKNPRILWLGIEQSEKLQSLAKKIEKEMEILGFAAERRPFSPHLTIGRFIGRSVSQQTELLEKQFNQMNIQFPLNQVSKINLYRSVLRPTGAVYTLLSSSYLKIQE